MKCKARAKEDTIPLAQREMLSEENESKSKSGMRPGKRGTDAWITDWAYLFFISVSF